MIFEKYILPGIMLDTFRDVTPEFLAERGIKYLISDIDNTLVTYDDPTPTPEVSEWFDRMAAAGVRVAFVSNNGKERVDLFNRDLGFVSYAKAGKPKTKYITAAMRDMGATADNTALLGDQLLTDAAAGARAGLLSIIVPPIKDKRSLFFRFKRWLEKPYLKKYNKLHKSDR